MARITEVISGISRLDRRWIFGAIALAVLVPLVLPIAFRATPSEHTVRFEEQLDKALAADKPIMVAVDFGPQTMAEMEPVLMAVLHRIFQADKPAVFLTFLPEAASPLRAYLAKMEQHYDLTYGEDYVFLGYGTAFAYTIYGMGTSIGDYFHTDDRGTPLDEMPLTRELENYEDVA
ncbi:MAG: hypothetical protein JRF63_13695, partial [Deltaproteobacteria bacterium]|nr:hypothetical protein [Deltaproteobacteria bacterium]